jgi:hypothetical protein
MNFPEHARVGRIVAKENFYGNIDSATRNLFQEEITRIIWEYKLAPESINLPAKKWPEMEVFRIVLKNESISEKVLKAIDSMVQYPILFIIEKDKLKKAAICYKEQGQKNENVAKVDTYFYTEWNDERFQNLKIDGLDIDAVFGNFVRQIAGEKFTENRDASREAVRSIKEEVEALKERERIQKQIDALTRKINVEPSLGKKQELAEERYKLKQLLK